MEKVRETTDSRPGGDEGQLSRWLDKQNKWVIAVAASGVHGLLYLTANRFQFVAPRTLELSPIDAWIPFIPETAWVYWSDYLLVFVGFQLCRAPGATAQFVKAFVFLIVAGTMVHWLYPTVFPRQLYPSPSRLEPITRAALDVFRVVDTPASCLPSLHAAAAYFVVFACWSQSRRGRWLLLTWATAVAVATLTLKQHYVVDLLAGLALAGAVWFVFYRWLPSIPKSTVRMPQLKIQSP